MFRTVVIGAGLVLAPGRFGTDATRSRTRTPRERRGRRAPAPPAGRAASRRSASARDTQTAPARGSRRGAHRPMA